MLDHSTNEQEKVSHYVRGLIFSCSIGSHQKHSV